ncbi:MAG TPA: DUF4430 domain-containing protein [Thermoanaerobaculia bacterium]|nr:DUF4430 domain-containing protein [Thermoanaerobaculia bacterium]
MSNIVKITIFADPNKPDKPTLKLPDIPWFAGITALQAMVIGEAMHEENFSFRVVYKSIFGAFIDSIDGVTDGDIPNHFWMFSIDGSPSEVGVSEAIIQEDQSKTSAEVEWRFADIGSVPLSGQAALKTKPLPRTT